MIVTTLSGVILMNGLSFASALAAAANRGRLTLSSRPPPAAALATMKRRRDRETDAAESMTVFAICRFMIRPPGYPWASRPPS